MTIIIQSSFYLKYPHAIKPDSLSLVLHKIYVRLVIDDNYIWMQMLNIIIIRAKITAQIYNKCDKKN